MDISVVILTATPVASQMGYFTKGPNHNSHQYGTEFITFSKRCSEHIHPQRDWILG